MKKLLLSLASLIATTSMLLAQPLSGGPDLFGYEFKTSQHPTGPTYNWIDITTLPNVQLVTGLDDDNTVGLFDIGFTFHYYWYNVDTFWIGSNGYIMFPHGQMSSPFPNIPSTALYNDFIAPFMSDLTFGGGPLNPGRCYYWTNNEDTLIVSWITTPFWAPPNNYTGSNTFQLILDKTDSSITFQYALQSGTSASTTAFLSIGIENNSGTIGLAHTINQYPPVNYAIKYYRPASTTFTINDAAADWNDNEETGGVFISRGGNPYTMVASVKNSGNTTLSPFNVRGRILGPIPAGTAQVTSNVMTGTLNSSQKQTITFPNTFTPTTAGVYRYIVDTQLAGDGAAANNSKTMELRVVDTTVTPIILGYDDGLPDGTGLSWQGGNGGVGVHFVPPFYPCELIEARFYIIANPNGSAFFCKIYDDNGPGGSAGTLLDSIRVPVVAGATINQWFNVPLPTARVITGGGFYIAWIMDGDGITLGQDQTSTQPASNRTYEVLGNAWAIYRYRETEDLMVNAYIKPHDIGISEQNINAFFSSELYPNPVADNFSIQFNMVISGDVSFRIVNLSGQVISEQSVKNLSGGEHHLEVNTSGISSGFYLFEMQSGSNKSFRKFVKAE